MRKHMRDPGYQTFVNGAKGGYIIGHPHGAKFKRVYCSEKYLPSERVTSIWRLVDCVKCRKRGGK